MGLNLLLHLLTFFAAALMCHYELARDRPHPRYLTTFFLLMSVGGVLGGIFNSLLAPLVFTHAFEYNVVLVLACALVPRLTDGEDTTEDELPTRRYLAFFAAGALLAVVLVPAAFLLVLALGVVAFLVRVGAASRAKLDRAKVRVAGLLSRAEFNALLDGMVPVAVGALYFYLRSLTGDGWYSGGTMNGPEWFRDLTISLMTRLGVTAESVVAIMTCAGPVMLCFFFVDRPLRFALCVLAILGYATYRQTYADGNNLIYSERSFFGILKVEEDEAAYVLGKPDKEGTFQPLRQSDGTPFGQNYRFLRLVHGTTLHGQQFRYKPGEGGRLQARFIRDDFKMILPGNPWTTVAAAGVIHAYDEEQEPLTYYHRTGPVGAMYRELRSRKNGADRDKDVAMVGLGTGSAACYAMAGQHLTFYEIDPAVERIVSDEEHKGEKAHFTFVPAARKRGAEVTIRMGDARLKLAEDKHRQFSLLLVDAFSSDSIPVHLLTVEAVQMYMDRLADDGILALHISNRWVRLESVVSAIANKLGLTARVWNDDYEKGFEGKTRSSWVVLARKPEYLGKLYSALGDVPFSLESKGDGDDRLRYRVFATTEGIVGQSLFDSPLYALLTAEFDELDESVGANVTREVELNMSRDSNAAWIAWTEQKYADLCDPDHSQRQALFREAFAPFAYMRAYREWLDARLKNPDTPLKQRVALILKHMREYGKGATLEEVMLAEHGHGFRRLETYREVEPWTDDFADVMRVMDIPGLQPIRKFFGLPTPLSR
jgi:hypothetical protein